MTQRTRYLDRMFGDRTGFVAVAVKHGQTSSWDETSFAWPADRSKLLAWARSHTPTSNVFICPSLRATAGRAKADMAEGQQWLWADVDWAKITNPNLRARVRERIAEYGTYVVRSGTGKNVHVYVKLTAPVDADEHLRLNTGLRQFLAADFKQADNSLLRLPGTINWKPELGEEGSPVEDAEGTGRAVSSVKLYSEPIFKQVSIRKAVEVEDEWEKVDIPSMATLPSKLRRGLRMEADEAIGRYGSRHNAIWAVTGDLMRAGLTPDQVHTFMDRFVPGKEKEDDERGFSLHRDVARRIAMYGQGFQNVREALDKGRVGIDDDGVFEELSDDDVASLDATNPLVKKELARREAMREVEAIEATKLFIAPPDDTSMNAATYRANPPDKVPHLIEGLAGAKHNVLITAQFKTGKTSFVIATLAKALCDGTPFAGRVAVPTEGRVVGHWNMEMDADELFTDYVWPADITNENRLEVWNGRGYRVNITTTPGKAWAVEWLRSRNVKVWTIDSLARLLHMCGVKEQENDAVLAVLMAIDEIKVEAGVDVSFVLTHTGRAAMEEGQERARGATVIDDWADARWIMTKDGDIRFLAVDGRGVKLATTSLEFDDHTHVSTLGAYGKNEARAHAGVQRVLELILEHPGVSKSALQRLMKERFTVAARAAESLIDEAKESGFISVKREVSRAGGKATIAHYAVETKSVKGRATPKVMDLTKT